MDFNYLRRNALFNPITQPRINPNSLSVTPDMMQSGQDNGQPDPLDSQVFPQTQSQSQTQPSDTGGLTAAYREMMNAPSGVANQRYKDFLAQDAPNRDDFKPTKMTRLSAILAGVSSGIRDGGSAGYDAANKIMDQPYNDALSDYKLKASKLEAGAGLEDKEVNNKVKTYRDYVTDKQNDRKDRLAQDAQAEAARFHNIQGKHYDALDSSYETPQQKMDRALGTVGATAKARTQGAKDVFDYEQPRRTADAIKVAGVRSDNSLRNQNAKFQSIQELKQYVADNVTKDKYTYKIAKDGTVVGINNSDPADVLRTTVDSGKLSDKDKIDLGLKAKQELKQTPGVATNRTTTKTVDGNKTTTESKTTPVDNKKEQTKVVPGHDDLEAVSTDGGLTWKARKKSK